MDQWAAIAQFGQEICAVREPARVHELTLMHLPRLVGADAAGLYVLDERHQPREVVRVGASDSLVHELESLGRTSDPFLHRLLRTRRPVDDSSLYGTPDWPKECERGQVLAAYGFAHSMIIPLLYESRLIGTINLARSKGAPAFTLEESRLAMELGRFASIAVSNVADGLGPVGARVGADAAVGCVQVEQLRLRSCSSLTPRERAVLELAAAGLRDYEIAAELTVTIHTVKQHLKHAYRKLGVRSRVEAIHYL
jgi:DNA-binding CsgD family transcriptional regulator